MRQNILTSDIEKYLDSIFDGVYIVDPDRNILFWNRGAEEMTGYSRAEVIGKSCKDDILNHIDENGKLLCTGSCPILKVFATAEPQRAKVYPLHRNGKRFPVETHISAIKDERGNVVASIEVFRDISDSENYRILQEKFQRLIQRYVSTATFEEVKQLATSNKSSETKMRELTILYMDVVGFTSYTEQYGAQEAISMLNELFGICDVITRETLGDIDKFVGDALMATFIDANDAVLAADRIMNSALPMLNQQRIENNKKPIQIRIGINSGQVLQGDIGTKDRSDLTVIGDVVNTASRIEKAADPGMIYISESTASRLSFEIYRQFEPAGSMQLRGKEAPLQLFRMTV